tara:strand:- start:946 stop:1077 length:132 start_codon:yes stop_codon:yes gene_type:complete
MKFFYDGDLVDVSGMQNCFAAFERFVDLGPKLGAGLGDMRVRN